MGSIYYMMCKEETKLNVIARTIGFGLIGGSNGHFGGAVTIKGDLTLQ